jgi:NADPH2 dehydrogenase
MEAGSSRSLPHQNVVLFDLLPFSSLSLCLSSWQVVDAVHENGSFIYLQLWALGRTAFPDVLQEEGGYPLIAPSPIPLSTKNDPNAPPSTPQAVPRALAIEEIKEYMRLFASAAENAVLRAGFDGVEIHAANGYLPDQFLQTNSNTRTDAYGGSVQNRARFVLEVTDAVVKAVGADRVGIRFSPWSTFQGENRGAQKSGTVFCFIFVCFGNWSDGVADDFDR